VFRGTLLLLPGQLSDENSIVCIVCFTTWVGLLKYGGEYLQDLKELNILLQCIVSNGNLTEVTESYLTIQTLWSTMNGIVHSLMIIPLLVVYYLAYKSTNEYIGKRIEKIKRQESQNQENLPQEAATVNSTKDVLRYIIEWVTRVKSLFLGIFIGMQIILVLCRFLFIASMGVESQLHESCKTPSIMPFDYTALIIICCIYLMGIIFPYLKCIFDPYSHCCIQRIFSDDFTTALAESYRVRNQVTQDLALQLHDALLQRDAAAAQTNPFLQNA